MKFLDVSTLAMRQLDLDRRRTRRFPELFHRKVDRMRTSPLAFLRGAAPLFYEILAVRRDLAEGPDGDSVLVGDMHLENFGAYRPERQRGKKEAHPAVFDLNDFDDSVEGPVRLDVLRLTTSLLLAGRELGADGVVALELSDLLLRGWAKAAFDGARLPAPPPPVATLIAQVRARSRRALLTGRTELRKRKRRFVRGLRYASLPKALKKLVPPAFARYAQALDSAPDSPIVDAALRIAGTGSLGGVRVAILLDDGSIYDMKEEGMPSASALLGTKKVDPAERVLHGYRACIARPPRCLGATTLGDLPMFVRRLSPQEDKLDLRRLRGADLPKLAGYLGALLGHAHARAGLRTRRWTKSDLAEIRARAVTLAGLHEAVYLALCDRMRFE